MTISDKRPYTMRKQIRLFLVLTAIIFVSNLYATNTISDAYMLSNSMAMATEAPAVPPRPDIYTYCGKTRLVLAPKTGVTHYWTVSYDTETRAGNYIYVDRSCTVTVKACNEGGCSGTYSFSVGSPKDKPKEKTLNDNSRCGNGSVTLTATAPGGSITAWYIADNTNNVIHEGNTFTPSIDQTKEYKVKFYNFSSRCGSGIMEISAIKKPVPEVPVPYGAETCAASAALDIKAISNEGFSIKWYGENGTYYDKKQSDEYFRTQTHPATMEELYYRARAYNETNGCESEIAWVNADVRPIPATPNVTVKPGCSGKTKTKLVASGVSPGSLVVWSTDGGATFPYSGNIFEPTISGTKTYVLFAGNGTTGCQSARREVVATPKNNPIEPDVSANKEYILNSETVTLTATPPGNSITAWYLASNTNDVLAEASTYSSSIPIGTTKHYKVKAWNSTTNCESDLVDIVATIKTLKAKEPESGYLSTNTLSGENESTSTEYNLAAYEGSFNIDVEADVPWHFEIARGSNWLSISNNASGNSSASATFTHHNNYQNSNSCNCQEPEADNKAIVNLIHNNEIIKTFYFEKLEVHPLSSWSALNSTQTTIYGNNGSILGQSIQYFDKMGKPTQSITRNIESNSVVASQTFYDGYGRPRYSTLPAATKNTSLNYISNYISGYTLSGNSEYKNVLNQYYSDDNEDEPYVPKDSYPFSRVDYSRTIPGAIRKNIMPGEGLIGQYTTGFTFKASPDEILEHPLMNILDINTLKTATEDPFRDDYEGMTKTVNRDIMGKEAVTYYNARGQVIASCMTSPNASRNYLVNHTVKIANETGYIDIHLPDDDRGTYIIEKDETWDSQFLDLATDQIVYSTNNSLDVEVDPGFYRLYCSTKRDYGEATEVNITFYMAHKYYSFYAYDDAGRLVRSISPEHVQALIRNNAYNADFLTQNTYNALGWLTESYSPDEGTTRYKYRRDGKIRFSQNEIQRTANPKRFSYTNYDKHGRLVEAGEYSEAGGILFENIENGDALTEAHCKAEDGLGGVSTYCSDQKYTYYGTGEYDETAPRWQNFTDNAVSKTKNANTTTWYSYNYDGSIEWVIKYIEDFDSDGDGDLDSDDYISIDYTYDFSGNLSETTYRKGKADEFTHCYTYNFNNQLKAVYTKRGDLKLAGKWTFNGNLDDESGNENTGDDFGGSFTTDRFGNSNSAYAFDGVDDYIDCGNDASLDLGTNDFSISVWFKTNATSMSNPLISKLQLGSWEGFDIEQEGEQVEFYLNGTHGIFTSSPVINDGVWHQIITTRVGPEITLYVDGEFVQSISSAAYASNMDVGANLFFGKNGHSNWHFEGSLDDISIYKKALSSDEAAALYFAEKNLNQIASWTFDNGSTNDESGNSNHGTKMDGATLTTDRFGNNSAYQFSTDADYINIGNAETFNQDFTNGITISAWFKFDELPMEAGKDMCLISKGGVFGASPATSFSLTFNDANNRLYFDLWDSDGSVRSLLVPTKTDWEVGRWYQVLATWDGTTNTNSQKLYLDGALLGQRTSTVEKILINTSPLYIGESYGRTNYNFIGAIDDLQIFNAPLTGTEALALYNSELLPKEENGIGSSEPVLQAKYYYYQHGPLKRVELAKDLQGIDYVYTLNGLLKSINNPNGADPGNDGYENRTNFAEDIFAMTLEYYNGDYRRGGVEIDSNVNAGNYDGNIAIQHWVNKGLESINEGMYQAWRYEYDDRNFLGIATFGTYNGNGFSGPTTLTEAEPAQYSVFGKLYDEETGLVTNENAFIQYDYNGNIRSMVRNAGGINRTDPLNPVANPINMDRFTYNYDRSSPLLNRLTSVSDSENNIGLGDMGNQLTDNYTYNDIGQLTEDKYGQAGEGHNFTYNVYGKVTHVHDNNGAQIAEYVYDDNGFRVKKVTGNKTTWYTRDLSGNILATYITENSETKLTEMPIYGSGRIGMANATNGIISRYVYELTDHLGNVRATVSHNTTDPNTKLDVLTASDYYPGGMELPGRTYRSSAAYPHGYQGQFAMKDEETGYDQFEARLYDNRINRWMTIDPAGQFWSPYLGMGNNPVIGLDPDGGYVYFQGNVGLHLAYIYNTSLGKRGLDYFLNNPLEHIVITLAPGNSFSSPNVGGSTAVFKHEVLKKGQLRNLSGRSDVLKEIPVFNAPEGGTYTYIMINKNAPDITGNTMHEIYVHGFLRKRYLRSFGAKGNGKLEHKIWLGYVPANNKAYPNSSAKPGSLGFEWHNAQIPFIKRSEIRSQYKILFPVTNTLIRFRWSSTTFGYRSIRYL